MTAWEATGIIRPAKPAASVACSDCGNLRRVHIEVDVHDVRHGYISCPECGIAEVDLDTLRRWALVAEHVLGAVFQSSTAAVSLSELVPGRLWRIGKAAWGGQPQELLFALCRRRDDADAVLQVLQKRPKSLLFVPTETDSVEWSDAVPNLVVALDSVVSMQGPVLTFDGSYVQGLLVATDEGVVEPKAKPRRRSSRTAKIEALKKALIDHLRAARDHAVATRDATGTSALLPCPTKEEFAKLVDIKPYDVTRCFQDKSGTDLNMLWEWAHDVDRILAYRT